MTFLTYFRDAWSSIVSNKLRSSLSMLGIIIGVLSVVVLMAFGAGVQKEMLSQMSSIINNDITISSKGWTTVWKSEEVNGYTKAITLTPELAQEIEDNFSQLSGMVTYGASTMGQVSNDDNSAMSSFAGVPIEYITKMGFTLDVGRLFDETDFSSAAEVAVVNKNVVDSLFPNTYAIGQKITVNNKEYTVIGTLEDSSIIGMVYIPLTTYRQRVAGNHDISSITIKLGAEEDNALWTAKVQYFLLRKYNVKHLDLAGFTLSSTVAIGDVIDTMMGLMSIFLGVIGGISLLVGGIGVMNIMLVSVTERTREIWIRKAIGALNGDIIQQFLIESVVITFFGGLLAIVFSFLIAYIVNSLHIENVSMYISWTVVIMAFTVTLAVGILAGILPANRAANLKPIDALRFE